MNNNTTDTRADTVQVQLCGRIVEITKLLHHVSIQSFTRGSNGLEDIQTIILNFKEFKEFVHNANKMYFNLDTETQSVSKEVN